MTASIAYWNGRLLPAGSIAISPVDSGFMLGTGVAEQLRTFGGKLFCLNEHLDRLDRSLAVVGVDPGLNRHQFIEVAETLVEHNHRLLDQRDDLGLSMVVTPGIHPSYASGGSPGPTVCLHTYPLPFHAWARKYQTGQAICLTQVRQVPTACWPVELKCRSRMHYYLADREASLREPDSRALLLDEHGCVTEASTANVFVGTSDGGLATPPAGTVLPGISASTVVQLAASLGIAVTQRSLSPSDLAVANEVLLTSTPWCLLPVTRFEGRPVGNGLPGPIFQRLQAAWSERVGLDIVAQAERFTTRK